jgi:Histidine kinase
VIMADVLSGGSPTVLQTLSHVLLVSVPLLASEAIRAHRSYLQVLQERVELAERTREQEARQRTEQERLRIARELHDLVAHSLTEINVQAGAAAERLGGRRGPRSVGAHRGRQPSRSANCGQYSGYCTTRSSRARPCFRHPASWTSPIWWIVPVTPAPAPLLRSAAFQRARAAARQPSACRRRGFFSACCALRRRAVPRDALPSGWRGAGGGGRWGRAVRFS